ncbi:MAG TPA: DUF4383 domain-containing protein [Pilimelia sp.]|nr:DUF4383 domain-containing protein [Pilimelia sp.]
MHTPVNHPLRPLYRVLGGLTGLYVLAFGIVGVVQTRGTELFGQPSAYALGLRTNLAFAILSIAAGAILVGAALIGRNVDQRVNFYGGYAFLVMGMLMLALLQTDANILNFSVSTCIVSFVIGLVLLTAGLYGKVGTAEFASAEEQLRHGG